MQRARYFVFPFLPLDCSYTAPLTAYIAHQVNDGEVVVTERRLGQLPIMVGSSHCHLSRMTLEERVRCGEEVYELGGYFICNGLERLIRLLQVPRRHVIMAIDRSSFTKRGPQYTSFRPRAVRAADARRPQQHVFERPTGAVAAREQEYAHVSVRRVGEM